MATPKPKRKRKNQAAVALARRRMVKMTPEQRSAVARAGAIATNRVKEQKREERKAKGYEKAGTKAA